MYVGGWGEEVRLFKEGFSSHVPKHNQKGT